MKRIIGFISLGVILLVVYMTTKSLFYSTISPKDIFITDFSNTNNKVTLKGTLLSSAIQYKSYNVQYKSETLFIKIKGGLITFSSPKEIDISIPYDKQVVKEVYLEGDSPSENLLIWPKK